MNRKLRRQQNDNLIRDTIAGAAVGILATWFIARMLGTRNRALAMGSGAVVGALRARQASTSGQSLALTLLVAFGATAAAALRRNA
jgi:hypothetical protein